MRQLLLAIIVAAGVCGCGGASVTEVLVVVDTDLGFPDGIDQVRIDVVGPDGSLRRSQGTVTHAEDLPRTVALVWRGGALGPVQVTATGLAGGANRVQRQASFDFVEGEIRVLRMDLLRSCIQHLPPCATDQTCGPEGCRAVRVDPSELEPYLPPQRFDGGPVDGGCMPITETCNETDDDCDGRLDEDFTLATDIANCGACNHACADPLNGHASCVDSACQVHCDDGFADCDSAPGCEANLSMPETCGDCHVSCGGAMPPFCEEGASGFSCVSTCSAGMTPCGSACIDLTSDHDHCGACDHPCESTPNAQPSCITSSCNMACDLGFFDCNVMMSDGCESQQRELDNCGACGSPCARPFATVSCTTGACLIAGCQSGYDDCDHAEGNGCEADLTTDMLHCGGCDQPCPPSAPNASGVSCAGSRCVASCQPGWGDCDGMMGNGCETRIDTSSDCGGCGLRCGASEVCAGNGGGYACASSCMQTMCGASCVDTTMDPSNCGRCGQSCPGATHSMPGCAAMMCTLGCDPGWDDCSASDGCETSIASDPMHCGRCDVSCPTPANTVATCTGGSCGTTCSPGFADCDASVPGCETNLANDVAHCGACATSCTLPAFAVTEECNAGVCHVLSCDPLHADCDGVFGNGCETNTGSDKNNCGSCGMRCRPHCCAGACC